MKFPLPSFIAAVLLALSFTLGCSAAEEVPDELVALRSTFDKDIAFATRPIRDRYLSRLESLKRSLGTRGDARGAAAVQDEIDRIRPTAGEAGAFAKFAGTWKLTYTSGAIRHYTIAPDGKVTGTQGEEKRPLPPGKLGMKGNDVILDFDGVVERLKLSDKTLLLEHFSPRTLYPASAANFRATGTLVSLQRE